MKYVKENYATIKQVEEINRKNDLHNLEHSPTENSQGNINRQRGAYLLEERSYMEMCDSKCEANRTTTQQEQNRNDMCLATKLLPAGSSTADQITACKFQGQTSSPQALPRTVKAGVSLSLPHTVSKEQRVLAITGTAVSTVGGAAMSSQRRSEPDSEATARVQVTGMQTDNINRPTEPCIAAIDKTWASIVEEGGTWKQVTNRKRTNNRFIGKKGKATAQPDSKLKAADIRIKGIRISAALYLMLIYIMF
ncbi:hypothetical protein PYW08_012936 [Mythimna loreyi]|uniref:Uncharacterized protein n=1 Tax=Mythimna loreyi TaxID=667449 RepID=A0ACC2PYT0_9NEOP|nr:hypothetical protein PYW08_012936 [Mythimna loreyi]